MVARCAGASLGLLAFAVTAVGGLLVQNPVTVTLSRSIFALFLFCVIGFVVGSAAELVVREHRSQRESEILQQYRDASVSIGADEKEVGAMNERDASVES